jgi:hypothetical protein
LIIMRGLFIKAQAQSLLPSAGRHRGYSMWLP